MFNDFVNILQTIKANHLKSDDADDDDDGDCDDYYYTKYSP